MRHPVNRIYYGPPGTGKTYELSKLLKREYEQAMTSVSNEEWRNQFIAEKIAPCKWWEGAVLALYDLDEKANVSQILEHPFINAIAEAKGRKDNLRQTIWSTLQERHHRRVHDRQAEVAIQSTGVRQERGVHLALGRRMAGSLRRPRGPGR